MRPRDPAQRSVGFRVLRDLGYLGHFLHVHNGGRSGKKHLLVQLHKSGGSLSQRGLQEAAGISSATLSELLAKLEGEGLIDRTRSEADRRQMDIRLTDSGTQRAVGALRDAEEFEATCLSCLTRQEQGELLGMLDRLADSWGERERHEARGCADKGREGGCA